MMRLDVKLFLFTGSISLAGVPNLHQGALRPLEKIFCTQSGYFTVSNSIFKFNFLPLVVSEILEGYKCTLWGPAAPGRPQWKHFCTQSEYFTTSNRSFNFNFLVLVVSEILRAHKCILRLRPGTPPSGIILTCAEVLAYAYITVKFQLRRSINVQLMESSLYNRVCVEKSPKMGFLGVGARIFGGNP